MVKELASEPILGVCPRCSRSLIGDPDKGEYICPACGTVALERLADSRPEWKAIDLEEKERRVRVGAPLTLTLHDLGVSTEISPLRDGYGRLLGAPARFEVERLRRWQSRLRASAEERSLSTILLRISEISDGLGLPRNVAETASHIIRIATKQRVSKSRSIQGMAAAAVYLACRKCAVGRTLQEVAARAHMDRYSLARYYRLVVREVEREYVPPLSLDRYISKLVDLVKADPRLQRLALQLASSTRTDLTMDGKSPAGVAAAYVYIASVLLGRRLSQREVAEKAQITEVTLRNRYKEILEGFRITQRLSTATG